MPAIAAAASVVGLPSLSTAQPGGIAWPAVAARRILPIAVALIAMSSSSGSPLAVGTAIAIGLLPTTASAPPGAGISGRVLDMTMPTLPARASVSA
ncbi:hypothetical protein D9M73_163990 [compost metagenome]